MPAARPTSREVASRGLALGFAVNLNPGDNMTRLRALFSALVLVTLSACGGVQQRETISLERSLSASGFQMRLADTPEKLAKLQKLPQRKILTQDHDGQPLFLYADAEDCKCLYAGTQKAYGNFQKLVAQQDEAKEIAEAQALLPASTDPDWVDVPGFSDWSPWY